MGNYSPVVYSGDVTSASADSPAPRRSGRRGGDSDTRGAILDAARDLFAAHGYEGVSVRAIAARAGVDSALIRHFFGDKQKLFATTVADRTVIPQRIAVAFLGPSESLGARVVDVYLGLWEDEETRPVLLSLVRSAMVSEHGIAPLLEVIGGRIQQTAPFPAGKDGRMRGFGLAATHLFGVAVARHILHLPMIVDMTHEELVAALAPEIQKYLTES